MLASIRKARTWSQNVAGRIPTEAAARQARAVFGPPMGGATYYGTQGYRWQQVIEGYRHWPYIAISAYIREIAGGEPPQIGRMSPIPKGGKLLTSRSKSWAAKRWVRKSLGVKDGYEFEPYDIDDPMVRVFENPNGPDVSYDLWAYTTLFYLLCGYVVLWVNRNQFGIPTEIWPIPTQWIQQLSVERSEGQYNANGYVVTTPWGSGTYTFPFDQCVVLQEHSPFSRYEGYATSIAIAEWLDTYESLVRSRLAQFKNGAVPNVHVALGEAYADPDEAWLARFYAKWFERFQGEDRAGLPIITGPDIELKQLGNLPPEMFRDGDEMIGTHTLAAFGTPKGVVGIEPANDTSAYAPHNQFVRFRVNPILTYFGQRMTEKVIRKTKGYEDGILFWHDRVVNDPVQINADIQTDLAGGAITPNEIRDIRGRPHYEHGGDDPVLDARAMVNWGTGKQPSADDSLSLGVKQELEDDAASNISPPKDRQPEPSTGGEGLEDPSTVEETSDDHADGISAAFGRILNARRGNGNGKQREASMSGASGSGGGYLVSPEWSNGNGNGRRRRRDEE